MRWLKRRSKRPPGATAGQAEASRALGRAEAGLERVRGEGREILAAAEKLKRVSRQHGMRERTTT